MRILHVIPQFPYFGGRTIVGGHASCLLTLSLAQARAGSTVTIASCAPKGSARIDDRLDLHSLFPLQRAGTVKFGLQFRRAIVPWARGRRRDFDVVHCHSGFADYFVVSSALKRSLDLPTLHTLYCPIPAAGGRWRMPFVHGLLARAARRLDALAAMSRNVAGSMRDFGLPDVRITAPPVDIERFRPPDSADAADAATLRAELGVAPDEVAILFVGNAKPQKNMIGVLRAFRCVKDAHPNARLIVTTELEQSSSDEHLATLRNAMTELRLAGDVIQKGIIDDMPRLMQACDLLVAPFLDSFGPSDYFMAVLEAMACGKPTIASKICGMPEVLDDERGRLVDPTNEEALVGAMASFVGDANRRAAAGKKARTYTERHFDPARVAATHDELYAMLEGPELSKDATNPAFYDADSTQYDRERWTSKAGARVNRAQQRIVADLTADWRDARVLEVGPGTARFTIPLCRTGNRMTILDISAGMLELARRNLDEAGVGEQLEDAIEGSIYELPFGDGAFDHAISLNVFNHLEHAGDALREIARVTKQGSTLLFNFANLNSYFWAAGRRINKQSKAVGQDVYSVWERPADVHRMIDAAGLDLVAKRGNVHTPRAMEKYSLGPVVSVLDRLSRQGPMRPLAPVQYCLCRKR